jgi:nucleoside phosphorylase
MDYKTAANILEEANRRGMRKAFFVTALLLEMEAVRAHLTDMGAVVGRDGTIFECGCFVDRGQEWLVVAAETGAGTHPAQNVASQGHNLFGDFEVQILVGIGGSRKKGAPIGSVVASDKVYMPYGGKAGNSGFTHRPVQFPLDLRLVNIAKKVRRDKVWPGRIRPPLHGTLPPLDAYPVTYPPIGLVAPIASIEAVLDDPKSELEALLAHGYSDTCIVEMEGYGAVYAASAERTPSIIVRGVSDMTQNKSDEDDEVMQPIAACHAAAFGFEMLSHWGQLNDPPTGRIQPTVKPPADVPEQVGTAAEGASTETLASLPAPIKAQVSVVLNLSADFGPEDQQRIDRFQSTLRAVAANENIEIVDARSGSLLLFVADPQAALLKVGRDRLREELAARENVELVGIVPLAAYDNLEKIRRAFTAASAELLSWPNSLPDGERMNRPELEVLRGHLDNDVSSTMAVLGAPGAGKSALLATLGVDYVARGWPVLAIKGDLLETNIDSEAALRDRLGLSDLPSTLIQQAAGFGPVLVLIDQLDALAGYLDLRTGRLSVLLNLVRQIGGLDNVHIVLSSRLFEFQHDVRLKSVSAESLTLQLPAWSEVLGLLEARGVSAAGWPADAQEVMRMPQALATYLQLNSRNSSEPFTSYQAMLEQLWTERVLVGDNGAAREQLATEIADRMANEESLWLATARFANRMTDLHALTGAGVLATLETSVGFSHQTLFEFALARSFAREAGRLSKFILERQSSLFLRPKLWAGLTYLRATDINAYHAELEAIWRADNLRPHLRVLVIDFLGAQAQPTDREALLMETALIDGNHRLRAYRALSGSEGWFARFAKSFIAEGMTMAEPIANAQMDVLARALPFAADRVLQLLHERWLPDASNDSRVWWVIRSTPNWTAEIRDIALKVLARTGIAPNIIDYQVSAIGPDHPEFALQLVHARLSRDLAEAIVEAERRAAVPRPDFATDHQAMVWRIGNSAEQPIAQLVERGDDWDSLAALAEQSPQAFLDIMWPWFLKTFEALERFANEDEPRVGYPLAYAADYRFEGESDLELSEPALLGAARIAVEKLAETDPDRFLAWVGANEAVARTPVQRLIAHGLAHQPERLASPGLDFILGDTRRFYLGSIHDSRGTSKALIAAISPHWTQADTDRFEAAVRAYQPAPPSDMTDPKDRMGWRHLVRRTQLDLLRSLPTHRMSAAAKQQVIEDGRRYGTRRSGATFSGARWIGPVLGSEAMAKASDDDIVNAFKELPDATGWDHPRNWMTGGNIQLARAFSDFAKSNANRAIGILKRLDKHTGTRAAAYTLDALAEDGAPEMVFGLLRDVVARGFDGEEFRNSAARTLERLSNRNVAIDEEFITLLESWLNAPLKTERPDEEGSEDTPSAEDDPIDTGGSDAEEAEKDDAIHRSLLWGYGGFRIVPGGEYRIIDALVHLRLLRKEPHQALAFLAAYLDREKDQKKWEGLTRFLHYLWSADAQARTAFIDRLFVEVPGLVGTRHAAHFLANAPHHDPDLVDRHLDAWKSSRSCTARQTYGEIVGVVALGQPEITWGQSRLEALLADETNDVGRAGAALSAANVFVTGPDRTKAADLLVRTLAAGGKGVWEAAFDVFRMVDELTLDQGTVAFLTAIADKLPEAPQLNATFVVDRLATLLPHQAPLVGRLALGLVEKWKAELGDIRTATAMATSQLADLAITLHRLGPETRDTGTALFEQLIETDAYEARQMLDEIDNRFREDAPTPRRRRLKRRSEVSPRRRGSAAPR